MLSKSIFTRALATSLLATGFVGCTQPSATSQGLNVIGETLSSVTSLSQRNGGQAQHVAIFDKTVRRIQQFNLSSMQLERSLTVQNPSLNHYLLYSDDASYIVDISTKNITIFNNQSQANNTTLHMVGNPRSAAFRPELGWLVVYDDTMSVGIANLNPDGSIAGSWIGGALLPSGATINSGDITEDGRLMLALSDGTIAGFDLAQTVAHRSWTATAAPYPSTVSGISWVGPVHGNSDQLLVAGNSSLALLSIGSQSVLKTYPLTPSKVQKYIKRVDPHIVAYDTNLPNAPLSFMYTSASGIVTRAMPAIESTIADSILDITGNTWTLVECQNLSEMSLYFDPDSQGSGCNLVQYTVDSLAALYSVLIPTDSRFVLGSQNVFAVRTSELGYAENILISDGSHRVVQGFNMPYIR